MDGSILPRLMEEEGFLPEPAHRHAGPNSPLTVSSEPSAAIEPVDLAPDNYPHRNTFVACRCGDGSWGVDQMTFWLCKDGVTEDEEGVGIACGLTEAEARLAADRLNGLRRGEAA